MTLEVNYNADGVSSVYPFPFAIETEADCLVLVNGVLQSGGYSVRGQGSIDGGAVVFDSAPVEGRNITIRRRGEIAASAVDAAPGYLADKLKAGDNITLTTETAPGGAQQVRIDSDVAFEDVAGKLKAGDNIVFTTVVENGASLLRIDGKSATEQMVPGTNVTFSLTADGRTAINAKGAAEQLAAGANVALATSGGITTISAIQPDMSKVLYRDTPAVVEAGFWSKPVPLTAVGGVVTPDPLAGTVFTLTATANLTLGFPAGMTGKAGMFMVVAKQDAIGGRTLALASGYKLASGDWSTEANAVNLLWVTSDGSGTVLDVVISQRGA